MVNEERIDNYLRGLMTPEEETQFIADCKTDSALREEAVMTALLCKGLQKPRT